MKSISLIVYIVTTFFCTEVTSMEDTKSILFPRPTGPYAIGTTAQYVIDKTQTNDFFGIHSPRELMIQVWYPADGHLEETPKTPYSRDAIAYWKSKLTKATNEELSSLDHIFTYAKKDAPISTAQARYPILLFSPGFAQVRTANTALCEHIASHGYIVISIDYTYFSEHVTFPDGRKITGAYFVPNDIKEQQLQDLLVGDIKSVIAELEKLHAESNSILHAKFDLMNIGIFGHSVGGSSALFAVKRIPQIKAGLNLDGGILGNYRLLENFDKPFMHILAEESVNWSNMLKNLTPEQLQRYGFATLEDYKKRCEASEFLNNELHKHQESDVYKVIIKGAGHMSFGDAIFLQENKLLLPFLYLRFGKGILPGKTILTLATNCIGTYFDKYLKAKKSDIKKSLAELADIEIT